MSPPAPRAHGEQTGEEEQWFTLAGTDITDTHTYIHIQLYRYNNAYTHTHIHTLTCTPTHLVCIVQDKGDLVLLVWLILLEHNVRGKRLKERLVNIHC